VSSNKRFVEIYKEGIMSGFRVVVDKETGVNYLYGWDGQTGGLTVLLDKDGKPVVTPLK